MENHYGNLLKTSWKYAYGYRKKMVLTYVMFVISNFIFMTAPYVLSRVLNQIQIGGDGMMMRVTWLLLLYASLDFWFWLFHGPARVMERTVAFYIVKNFNEDMFDIISKLPLKWHKDHHSGNTISRIRKASDALKEFTNNNFDNIATIVRVFLSLGAIFFLLPKFGFLALGIGVSIVLMIFKFDKFLVATLDKTNEKTHIFESTFFDYITNITTVITLRLEKLAKNETIGKIQSIFPIWRKNIRVNEVKWFAMNMGLAAMTFIILFTYIYERVSAGEAVMVGSLMALFQYTERFSDTFYRLGWQYEQLVWRNTDIKTVNVIKKAYAKLNKKFLENFELGDWHKIQIKNLHFKYEDQKHLKHTLNAVNVDLEKGLKIAFVGESGSGKSTLMTLIRGLEEAGRVIVDIDGNKFNSLKVISDTVTLIPQEPEIFENTIKYNITAGIHHTNEELAEVCRLARFDSVLPRLPKGLKTDIKEKGVNLSGGEKQRLALARGIFAAKESQIILMDEPTSSVDSRNEIQIYKNLFEVFDDRCIIASVHRLNLLKMFDILYVFEKGKLIEKGDFGTLVKAGGLFQSMWHSYEKNKA
ncbi:MAG: ABC transporter ATP-binding protein [Candidatus Peregrinibacteria bacterium]|nr:ABC transporter ATP-binding protein [Candidatus Peregrinibacteria bacterium]MDZ4245349.1 ABC transporter ATP-binding protein [Candidatus Gracilibacteria bacterium]